MGIDVVGKAPLGEQGKDFGTTVWWWRPLADYCRDVAPEGGPIFHARDQSEVVPSRRTGVCEQCNKIYEPQRSSARFCSETCRQRAHRSRLSVTPSVTPAPSDSSDVFRYVRHADVPRFMTEGWELLPALDGTHHGEYSALMRRRVEE